jgi:hypothetical protein
LVKLSGGKYFDSLKDYDFRILEEFDHLLLKAYFSRGIWRVILMIEFGSITEMWLLFPFRL